jgi:hypothetical protein
VLGSVSDVSSGRRLGSVSIFSTACVLDGVHGVSTGSRFGDVYIFIQHVSRVASIVSLLIARGAASILMYSLSVGRRL